MNDVIIKVENLTKTFKLYNHPKDRLKEALSPFRKKYHHEFHALKGLSFEIRKGESVGILGKNGAGKSTLLKVLTSVLTPTSGIVQVQGRIAALLELGAGFNTELSGMDNIFFQGAIMGFTKEEMELKLKGIIDFADIGEFISQPVKIYSSGMFARLAFSIAINVQPELLIVDEALSVGDIPFQAKCMKKIRELQDAGTTILFVSHDAAALRSICQKAIWLVDGKIQVFDEINPVTASYLECLYSKSSPDNINKVEGQALISHWGSHKGQIIIESSICKAGGIVSEFLNWNEAITIKIKFKVLNDVNYNDTSIAFSIKSLDGTDLIISSMQLDHLDYSLNTNIVNAEFTLCNPLVNGKYYLNVALEDRFIEPRHYYEYIEGAFYFTSVSEKKYGGIFQPIISQCFKESKDAN